jgi:hypothetical protein
MAVLAPEGTEQAADIGWARDVGRQRPRRARDLSHGSPQGLVLTPDQGQVSTLPAQNPRDLETDPAASADDHDDLAFESAHKKQGLGITD